MNREKSITRESSTDLYKKIIELHNDLDNGFISQYKRSLPLNEEILDRWGRAKKLGFGRETSIYDSSLVFGDVKVGTNCWIGPFTIIDGSGGLEIGNFCTISVGVQIYTHDNIRQTLSSGQNEIERASVKIGNNVYIGPNSVIVKGIKIGNNCIIGAFSLVNRDVPDNSIVFGQPAKMNGSVIMENGKLEFVYFKK
jgi:acetyltransferase-like isoleucine patch superfamily enzyme